jgi:hypothetical protein
MMPPQNLTDMAQACLAVSLGYLALDRFRYQDSIESLCRQADHFIEGMPPEYQKDKAWKDLRALQSDGNIRRLFLHGVDRIATITIAAYSFLTLLAYPLDSAWGLASLAGALASGIVAWVSLAMLSVGILTPVFFVWRGRKALGSVTATVETNVRHLAARYKENNAPVAEEMMKFVAQIHSHNSPV